MIFAISISNCDLYILKSSKYRDFTYLIAIYIIGLSEAQLKAEALDIEEVRKGGQQHAG